MNHIPHCDDYTSRYVLVRWHFLACSITCCVPQENFFLFHIIRPLLTKLVKSRWLDIGCLWTSTPSWSMTMQKNKNKRVPMVMLHHNIAIPSLGLYTTHSSKQEVKKCQIFKHLSSLVYASLIFCQKVSAITLTNQHFCLNSKKDFHLQYENVYTKITKHSV